jgi:hypothetical protein
MVGGGSTRPPSFLARERKLHVSDLITKPVSLNTATTGTEPSMCDLFAMLLVLFVLACDAITSPLFTW